MPTSVERLSTALKQSGIMLVTAESCTGGLLAAAITDMPGSSAVFERGFVTYSNESKIEELGVPAETIKQHGAVSRETALAMATGALRHSRAQLAVSITGIAGPDGGTEQKPVGTVFIGYGMKGNLQATAHQFSGDRAGIRAQSVEAALDHLLACVSA